MSQTLYLLRHAKAEPWSPGINDFERALAQRGQDHMQRFGNADYKLLEKPYTKSRLASALSQVVAKNAI